MVRPRYNHGKTMVATAATPPAAEVSLAMALAVPITAVAFASCDIPLLGPGQPLDRRTRQRTQQMGRGTTKLWGGYIYKYYKYGKIRKMRKSMTGGFKVEVRTCNEMHASMEVIRSRIWLWVEQDAEKLCFP